MRRVTINQIRQSKNQHKLAMVTAYDYLSAKMCDAASMDMILVGDSVGNICLGYPDTLSVTLDDICHHAAAVSRGVTQSLVLADMPFGTADISTEEAKKNAWKLIQKGRVQAVKIEANPGNIETIEAIIQMGVPVMGHIGFTPQSLHQIGGYKIQGKTQSEANRILQLAEQLEAAGCFAVLLELVPSTIADQISKAIDIPTIGIGAGPHCDGQVLVFHDLIGYEDRRYPKFVKHYCKVHDTILDALTTFKSEVVNGQYPTEAHSYD